MSKASFAHVGLSCKDIDATVAFYSRHFGFHVAREIPLGSDKIVFLKLGEVYLELFTASGDAPEVFEKDGPAYPGYRHMAFTVDSVDGMIESLGAATEVTLGPLSFDDFIPGWRTAWIKDPDGRIVEITQGYKD